MLHLFSWQECSKWRLLRVCDMQNTKPRLRGCRDPKRLSGPDRHQCRGDRLRGIDCSLDANVCRFMFACIATAHGVFGLFEKREEVNAVGESHYKVKCEEGSGLGKALDVNAVCAEDDEEQTLWSWRLILYPRDTLPLHYGSLSRYDRGGMKEPPPSFSTPIHGSPHPSFSPPSGRTIPAARMEVNREDTTPCLLASSE